MKKNAPSPVFNTPFELGLRMVYLLQALFPRGADLQKLVLLDYAVVYSADLKGPTSLHTPVPYRGGELMSRRELIEQGLHLMSTRALVSASWGPEGITYFAGENSRALTGGLGSRYLRMLDTRCAWVAGRFGDMDSLTLTEEFSASGHLWGAEVETQTYGQRQLWE